MPVSKKATAPEDTMTTTTFPENLIAAARRDGATAGAAGDWAAYNEVRWGTDGYSVLGLRGPWISAFLVAAGA